MTVIHKPIPEIAVGDRVNWPDGCHSVWGTVTDVVEVRTVEGVNGPVLAGVTVCLRCERFPTFDACGWPQSEERTVTRVFRFPSDVHLIYTPAAT